MANMIIQTLPLYSGSELDMELDFIKTLKSMTLYMIVNGYYEEWNPQIYRQVLIKEIGRRTDVTILRGGKQLINYELKTSLNDEVIRQAISHLEWADYSNIVIPSNSSKWLNKFPIIITNGLGLVIWSKGSITEVIPPKYNRKKNKPLCQNLKYKFQNKVAC